MSRTRTVTASAILIAVAVTGCSSSTDTPVTAPSPPVEAPAAAVAEPAPEPTEESEPALPAPGERITDQKRAVAAYQAGLGYYQWRDGTYTIVDPTAPLPDELLADIKALIPPLVEGPPVWTSSGSFGEIKIRAGSTRKVLVFIRISGAFGLHKELVSWGWDASSEDQSFRLPQRNGKPAYWDTRDQALRHAHEVIATKADPHLYEVIDLGATA